MGSGFGVWGQRELLRQTEAQGERRKAEIEKSESEKRGLHSHFPPSLSLGPIFAGLAPLREKSDPIQILTQSSQRRSGVSAFPVSRSYALLQPFVPWCLCGKNAGFSFQRFSLSAFAFHSFAPSLPEGARNVSTGN
jgi:hypothetical protein